MTMTLAHIGRFVEKPTGNREQKALSGICKLKFALETVCSSQTRQHLGCLHMQKLVGC